MNENKSLGGPGPDAERIHPVRLTIHDFFDPSFFQYQWWEKGVIERKSRIILVGRLEGRSGQKGNEKDGDEGEDQDIDVNAEDESTRMVHAMLHRLAEYCNHHTVVILSEKAEQDLCKAIARPLPRLYVFDAELQEWVVPTPEQYESWVFIAASDELKTYPLVSHSNWTLC